MTTPSGKHRPPSVPPRGRGPLHVLVVDDSAVVRQFMWALLESTPDMTGETAADPLIAMEKMARRRPDVILLDLKMPGMDGLTFLRQLMEEDPIPVVVCSSYAETDAGLEALELGAVEVLAKPLLGVQDFLADSTDLVLDALRAAAGVRDPALLRPPEPPAPRPAPEADLGETIVVIGASTGGIPALHHLLGLLPRRGPAVLVVQHLPEHFTGPFAQRLNSDCAMRVREARDGDPLDPGRVLIAPGGHHAVVRTAKDSGLVVHLVDEPAGHGHRPSVDVLFHSVAEAAGRRAVGILMSGMGQDGVDGLRALKDAGALTIAQDEASCAVFGMPRRAIESGAALRTASPDLMADLILRHVAA